MLKTKIKVSIKETYVKTNSYKNEAIFTMNHFTPR